MYIFLVFPMKNENFIRYFGWFSILVAILYFVLETWFHVQFGQSLIQLLADYMAISLLIFGGITVLRNQEGVGILCGAWGYSFCINYRAFAWRMDEVMAGSSTVLIDNTLKVLIFALVFSLTAFIISLILCYPTSK